MQLIAAMDREVEKIPGVVWGFSQPIEDNMEEAVSGVKGELAVKLYGDDLKALEETGDEIVSVMQRRQGRARSRPIPCASGQPNLNFIVDRRRAARYGINVSDVQDAIETAVGGKAVSQVLKAKQRYDLVVRYQSPYRETKEAIENIRLVAPSGERVSLAQLCNVKVIDGASEIYREENSRYVAIKYSVRGRDLGSTVEEAMKKVTEQVKLPTGYHLDWAGEYESQKRSSKRLMFVLPITLFLIFIILYTMFQTSKWALLILANLAMAPLGGLLALLLTGTHFSVSSRRGLSRAFRRLRANWRHHARIHQPTPRSRLLHRRFRHRRRGAPLAPDHDDHARRHSWPAARRRFPRHRLGFATPLRHCDRRRIDFRPYHEHFSIAYLVCVDRARRR